MKARITGVLLGVLVALIMVSAALAATSGGWRQFSTEDLDCTISRPHGSEGVACVASTSDTLDGWSVLMGVWGVQVKDPSDRLVFQRKQWSLEPAADGWPSNHYNLRNESVACMKGQWLASCIIRRGGMQGWGFIFDGATLEISDDYNHVKFRRGRAIK